MLYSIARIFVSILVRPLLRLRVFGAEKIPPTGALIFAPNHVSYLDIPVLGVAQKRHLHFIGKSSLFRSRLSGWLYRSLGGIPLQNNHSPGGGLKEAVRRLKDGACVVLYPEGRRSLTGDLQKPQPGLGMLSALSGAPVIPVFIDGTEKVLPVGKALPRLHRVSVYIGEPIVFKEENGKEG
ncbi:MAG TPA: lysophospholipid acyltransferase family protein, partial [Nitrospiria bacterium]|nr:lysophospholipid acyltransferase family protein [Nitrospiria bacterium]